MANPQKKGLLGRFSAFLKSDTMSIGSKDNSPQSSPQNPQAAAAAAAAGRRDSSSLSANSPSASGKFSNNNNNNNNGSNNNVHNNSMNRTSKSPSISPGEQLPKNNSSSHTQSPMVGHLESGGGSFASSASPSFAKRSSDDGSAADHQANHNKGDAFKMFSIVGPTFQQNININGNSNTTTATTTTQPQAPQYQDSVQQGTSAARSRKASFLTAMDLPRPPPIVPHNNNGISSNTNNNNNNNNNPEQGHHRRRSSNAHEHSSQTLRTPQEIGERMNKLLSFFSVVELSPEEQNDDSWMKVKMNESPESASRTKDILEKIAESDHDLELALTALKAGYGFLGQYVSPSQVLLKPSSSLPSPNSIQQQQQQAQQMSAPSETGDLQQQLSTTGEIASSLSKRRGRSQTIAKADLMTLLTPLFPSEKPIREKPTALVNAESPQPLLSASSAAATASTSPEQHRKSAADQQQQQQRAQSLNTGRVHGNRYISADTDAEPQQWFYFGGCPVVVNYSDSKATIGKPLFISTLPSSHNNRMNGDSPHYHASSSSNNNNKRDSGFNFNNFSSNGGGVLSIRDQEIPRNNNKNKIKSSSRTQNDDDFEEEEDDDYTADQILALVNEQIEKADQEIGAARKYNGILDVKDGDEDREIDSDLSSELSGRSFGSMVDIEELVRSLN